MRDAGIDSSGSLNHPIHLWPQIRSGRPANLNFKQIVDRFRRGLTFYGTGDGKVTVNDVPKGTVVVLHAAPKRRLRILVQ